MEEPNPKLGQVSSGVNFTNKCAQSLRDQFHQQNFAQL